MLLHPLEAHYLLKGLLKRRNFTFHFEFPCATCLLSGLCSSKDIHFKILKGEKFSRKKYLLLELRKTWKIRITWAKTRNTRAKFQLDTYLNLTAWNSMKLESVHFSDDILCPNIIALLLLSKKFLFSKRAIVLGHKMSSLKWTDSSSRLRRE